MLGIDRRVQNRKLYGVGNKGGIYTLSASSAAATKVGQLSVPLLGSFFGVDFDPAANALRIISDTGQNLRQPFGTSGDAPAGATIDDGVLNYSGETATYVTAAAYTNNDLNADTATTLFDLDITLDQTVIRHRPMPARCRPPASSAWAPTKTPVSTSTPTFGAARRTR